MNTVQWILLPTHGYVQVHFLSFSIGTGITLVVAIRERFFLNLMSSVYSLLINTIWIWLAHFCLIITLFACKLAQPFQQNTYKIFYELFVVLSYWEIIHFLCSYHVYWKCHGILDTALSWRRIVSKYILGTYSHSHSWQKININL